MLTNFHRLCKAVSVTALTLGVAFAQPAQKADAQSIPTIRGGGASSVTDLLSSVNGPVKDYVELPANSPTGAAPSFNYSNGYIVTGSGFGRTAFLNGTFDFVATDGLGTSFGAGATVVNNQIVAGGVVQRDPRTNVPYVVINEAYVNLAFPYNVKFSNGTNFNVSINTETACRIVRGNASLGDPVNWNQVRNSSNQVGPNLIIKRVGYGDTSGLTAIHSGPNGTSGENDIFTDVSLSTRGTYGFIPLCNGSNNPNVANAPTVRLYPGGPFIAALPTFATNPIQLLNNTGDVITIDGRDSGRRVGQNNFNDGTRIPNQKSTDIIVTAASTTGNAPADPIGAAARFGNDNDNTPQNADPLSNPGNFRGSYSRGVINAIRANNGTFGYTEAATATRAIANNSAFAAAQQISGTAFIADNVLLVSDTVGGTPRLQTVPVSGSTLAVGPTYVIFRGSNAGDTTTNTSATNKIFSAADICFGAQFSGFLGNQAANFYPKQAGFNIDARVFPYNPANSTEQGVDTDNYGDLNTNFGPCQNVN